MDNAAAADGLLFAGVGFGLVRLMSKEEPFRSSEVQMGVTIAGLIAVMFLLRKILFSFSGSWIFLIIEVVYEDRCD